jgi:hypothetical protein
MFRRFFTHPVRRSHSKSAERGNLIEKSRQTRRQNGNAHALTFSIQMTKIAHGSATFADSPSAGSSIRLPLVQKDITTINNAGSN